MGVCNTCSVMLVGSRKVFVRHLFALPVTPRSLDMLFDTSTVKRKFRCARLIGPEGLCLMTSQAFVCCLPSLEKQQKLEIGRSHSRLAVKSAWAAIVNSSLVNLVSSPPPCGSTVLAMHVTYCSSRFNLQIKYSEACILLLCPCAYVSPLPGSVKLPRSGSRLASRSIEAGRFD